MSKQSIDWPATLRSGAERGLTPVELARELRRDSAAVYAAEKRHGVTLARRREARAPTFAAPFVASDAEEWRAVLGYEAFYEVSSFGRVRRIETGRLRKLRAHARGYPVVSLGKGSGRPIEFRVHRLVAVAFHSNPGGLPHVNHIDCDKQNNRATNLEWLSFDENFAHGRNSGRALAINNPKVKRKLSPEDVIEAKRLSDAGMRSSAIARKFKVNPSTIGRIVNGKKRVWG